MAKREEKIKKYCDDIIKRNNLSQLKYTWITSFISAITLIVIATVSTTISVYFYFTAHYGLILMSIAMPISIVLLIVAVLIIKTRSKILKIKSEIIISLDFFNYYSLAFKEFSNDKYQLSSLSTSFDVMPTLIPKWGSSKTDEALNFFYNGINYSFGTVTTETIIRLTGMKTAVEHLTYTRSCCLNLRLEQTTNLRAIIQPSKSFIKHFKLQDKVDLESTEFKQIYSVETDDQIMIIKVLKPKVVENLINLAYTYENKPNISILN